MAVCEKCWGDAYVRSLSTPGKDQAEHYRDLLEERKGTPCAMVDVDSVITNPAAPVKSEGEDFDGSVQFELQWGNHLRRIRVNCPDEDNDIYIQIKRDKQYAGVSLSLDEAEELAKYILGHVDNARKSNSLN